MAKKTVLKESCLRIGLPEKDDIARNSRLLLLFGSGGSGTASCGASGGGGQAASIIILFKELFPYILILPLLNVLQ